MKLKISSVADKGTLKDERIIIKATTDADVGDFVLFQTGFNKDTSEVTTHVYHAYWFPWKKISAGDLVVVYTKSGTGSEKKLKERGTAHFFYWGLPSPIWNTTERAPVLLYTAEWESKGPQEL